MRKFISKLVLPLLSFSLILPGVSEASSGAGAKTPLPENIPADYVPTPMGLYVSPKCVIYLFPPEGASGYRISKTAGIRQPDGTYTPIPACTLPRYNRDGSLYQEGVELMSASGGNHDLIISFKGPEDVGITTNFSQPHITDIALLPVPRNISGQTIFLTSGMSNRGDGIFSFLAFNMRVARPYQYLSSESGRNEWRAGAALANVNGNVIMVMDAPSSSGMGNMFLLDRGLRGEEREYVGMTYFPPQGTPFLTYDTPLLLPQKTMISMQTFNITSCDMLPDAKKIFGNSVISLPGSLFTTSSTVWSSGLCNLAATASQNTSNPEFKITYDTSPTSKGKSAKITFTAN